MNIVLVNDRHHLKTHERHEELKKLNIHLESFTSPEDLIKYINDDLDLVCQNLRIVSCYALKDVDYTKYNTSSHHIPNAPTSIIKYYWN